MVHGGVQATTHCPVNTQSQLDELDRLIAALRTVKTELKKADRTSDKARTTNYLNSSPSQITKAATANNWQQMELDKAKVRAARLFTGSCVDVGTEERIYQPSGFHEYKF